MQIIYTNSTLDYFKQQDKKTFNRGYRKFPALYQRFVVAINILSQQKQYMYLVILKTHFIFRRLSWAFKIQRCIYATNAVTFDEVVERLERLEQENKELQIENREVKMEIREVKKEISRLKTFNHDLMKQNERLKVRIVNLDLNFGQKINKNVEFFDLNNYQIKSQNIIDKSKKEYKKLYIRPQFESLIFEQQSFKSMIIKESKKNQPNKE